MPKLILSVAYRGILDSPLICEESRQIEKRIRADYHDITEWAASQGWTAKVEAQLRDGTICHSINLDYSKLSDLSIRVGPMRIIEADYLVSVY